MRFYYIRSLSMFINICMHCIRIICTFAIWIHSSQSVHGHNSLEMQTSKYNHRGFCVIVCKWANGITQFPYAIFHFTDVPFVCRLKTIIFRLSLSLHFHQRNAFCKCTYVLVHSIMLFLLTYDSIPSADVKMWMCAFIDCTIMRKYIPNESSWVSFDDFQMNKEKKKNAKYIRLMRIDLNSRGIEVEVFE